MKNLSLEQIAKLESMSKEEVIRSFKEYDAYTTSNLTLLTNITTLDKALYIGIMLNMGMKAKEVCEKTNLTKSHVSRLGKVGKWAINSKQQYQKLVDTAGTSLSVRLMSDAITHDTINGVCDWSSLVEAEKAYKESTKTSKTETKPTSDKSTPKAKAEPSAKPTTSAKKHAFLIRDFERMNSTSMYSAIIRLVDAYKESGDNVAYMENFVKRLNELKH